jgi:putative restriction endonuclease
MRYWWVNQNKTFKQETAGGYLWSPQANSDGSKNPFYDFMTQVEPGDIIFSYKGTYLAAIGIASSGHYEFDKPFAEGVGSYWNKKGWRVDVDYLEPRRLIQPKSQMGLIAPLLPGKYSPIRANGSGNQIYLAAISSTLGALLLDLVDAPPLTIPVANLEDIKIVPEEQEILVDLAMSDVQKATMILARRGQGKFRDRVQTIEKQCRVTGVHASQLLIASHIKPWSHSEPVEKLDGNNGLFLSPHVDKLFNDGFITFTPEGCIEVADNFDRKVLSQWGIDVKKKYGHFNSDQTYFLDYHNETIFGSTPYKG